MKSVLRGRIILSIVTVLLAGCLLLGVLLFYLWPREARVYAETNTYKDPNSELILEVRHWEEDGYPGWDFVLLSPDENERLLERTHALAGGFITQVDWQSNCVNVHTHAPMGVLTMEFN